MLAVPLKLAFALAVAMVLDNAASRAAALPRALLPAVAARRSVAIAVLWRQIFARRRHSSMRLLRARSASRARAGSPTPTTRSTRWCCSRLAVRLADDHLPRRPAADSAGALRGRRHGRRQRWQQFCKITLPLLAPVIFFNLVLQTIEAFKAFTPAFIISRRHRRADRFDAVLHAVPLPGGLRQFPDGLCVGAGLGARS